MKKQAKMDWSDLTALDGRSGQEALILLEELDAAQGESVYQLLGELAPMVMQQGQTCPLSVRVFCALYELSFQKTLNDLLLILSFMGELRTLLMGLNLSILAESDYLRYQDTLWRMECAVGGLLAPEQLQELLPADKSAFAMLYVSLLCSAPDSIAFLWNRPFEQAFHVCCPHCGNDLHSLYIGLEETDRDKNIVEAERPQAAALGEAITSQETYRWLGGYLEALGETYYATLLPRLYGWHSCGQCGQAYQVMEGILGYITENMMVLPQPQPEMIARDLQFADQIMLQGEYERAYYYFKLARSQQKRLTGANSVEVARIDLAMTAVCQFRGRYDEQRFLAKRAVDILKPLKIYPLDLAEAYRRLGYAWHADLNDSANNAPELAKQCYQQALAIFDQELGADSEKSQLVRQNMALLLAEEKEESQKSIDLLKSILAEQEASAEPDAKAIASINKNMAEIYAETLADYNMAIAYYQKYLDYACHVYGAESDYASDGYRELAELYLEDGQAETACTYYEKALAINIRELGRLYLLPDIFKSMLTGVLKAVGQERDQADIMVRSMSAAESFDDLGMLYLSKEQPKKALNAFEKALALRQGVFDMPIKEIGDSYRHIAEVWLAMADGQAARQSYEQAAAMYAAAAEADEQDGRPIFLAEAEACREALGEIAVILEDPF